MAFGYVLKSRWPGSSGTTTEFALILFVGLIVHSFFAECFVRAPQLILGNTNFVKRVVFPLNILVWSMMLSALFHFVMNALVLLVLQLWWRGEVHATALLLPLVLAPLVLLTAGIGWTLPALGVYLRDIGQIAGVVTTAMLFLSSAIVPPQSQLEKYRWVFQLNPLTFIIDQAREVVIWGRLPDWQGLVALYAIAAMAVAVLGFALFQKMRCGFSDVP